MKKQKEIGLPKNSPKALRDADEKYDKAHGITEGSAKDIAHDKKMAKEFMAKKKGKK